MAETTFSFGGVASTFYSLSVKSYSMPLMPPTRDRLVTVPTRHGQYNFAPYFDPLKIDFDVWIVATSRADLNAITDAIAIWLDPTQGDKPLIISDYPDRYYLASYSGIANISKIVEYGEFKIPFLCVDPFAKAVVGGGAPTWITKPL